MKTLPTFLLGCILFLLSNCSIEPQPINYGIDNCELCKMTISDKKFGAELITSKGKIFKFDSGECLINYINSNNFVKEQHSILVTDYQSGNLIDAKGAYYLVSENLRSPMGAGLSAYQNQKDLENLKSQFNGSVYSWDQVLTVIK